MTAPTRYVTSLIKTRLFWRWKFSFYRKSLLNFAMAWNVICNERKLNWIANLVRVSKTVKKIRMAPLGNGIFVVRVEMSTMMTTMKRSTRWNNNASSYQVYSFGANHLFIQSDVLLSGTNIPMCKISSLLTRTTWPKAVLLCSSFEKCWRIH